MSAATHVLPDIEEELSEFDGQGHRVREDWLVQGGVVVALCGKKWIPRMVAGAEDLPRCTKCEQLFAYLEASGMVL